MKKLIGKPLIRRGLWVVIGLLYLLPLFVVQGAFDSFIKIGAIKGESLDRDHKDWIDVTSVQFGVSREVAGAGSTRTNGPARFKEVSFTKWIDKSSPDLMLSVCDGKHIPECVLVVRKSENGVSRYLRYKLKDVLVTSAKPSGDSNSTDPVPAEAVTLNFTKIEYEYSVVDDATGGTNFHSEVTCDVPDERP